MTEPIPVRMPLLGLTMEEGTVAQWLKAEGDAVQKDEPLLMVEMDKGTIEVPSPATGVLHRILVPQGQTVPVKAHIAEIGEAGAARPVEVTADAQTENASVSPPGLVLEEERSTSVTPDAMSPGRLDLTDAPNRQFASPRARRRARELGLDLSSVRGSGPQGRIVEEDVLAAAQSPPMQRSAQPLATPVARRLALEHGLTLREIRGTGPGGRITHDDVLQAAEANLAASHASAKPSPSGATTAAMPGIEPLSRLRRITAERMAVSARTVAPVTLFRDVDFTEVARFRRQVAQELERLGVPRLPWDAALAKAVALALVDHPRLAAQWVEGQGLRPIDARHVGVAVALEPEGLVVPVLRDADVRPLRELASDLLGLLDRARAGRLAPTDMDSGVFTITNLGVYGVDGFTPIVNPPQCAILGVGRIAERPIVVDGRLEPRTLCTLSLSFDHRVVDGAGAAAFLARLSQLLERPYALLGV